MVYGDQAATRGRLADRSCTKRFSKPIGFPSCHRQGREASSRISHAALCSPGFYFRLAAAGETLAGRCCSPPRPLFAAQLATGTAIVAITCCCRYDGLSSVRIDRAHERRDVGGAVNDVSEVVADERLLPRRTARMRRVQLGIPRVLRQANVVADWSQCGHVELDGERRPSPADAPEMWVALSAPLRSDSAPP